MNFGIAQQNEQQKNKYEGGYDGGFSMAVCIIPFVRCLLEN